MLRIIVIGLIGLVAAACSDGMPRPKIKQIETTFSGGASLSRQVAEYAYSGDRLKSISYFDGNELSHDYMVSYKGDLISAVDSYEYDSEDASEAIFSYTDERIELLSVTGDVAEYEVEFQWDDDFLTLAETYYDAELDSSTEYKYNDEERLDRIIRVDGSLTTESVFSYDNEDTALLKSIRVSYGGDDQRTTFSLDDDEGGRVKSVSDGSSRYAIEYNEDGWIQQVTTTYDGDVLQTVRYTYTDGDVDGFTPVPGFSGGSFFGMDGRPLPLVDPLAGLF